MSGRKAARDGALRRLAGAVAALLVAGACAREPRALVVLTHPDDELTMVDYLLDRGPRAHLLFLTRGEGPDHPEGRPAEAEAARRFYGSGGLALRPAPLLPFALDPSFPWHRWEVAGAIDAVAGAIDRLRPEEVVTWMPNVAAVHGEHQLTGAITVAACLKARHPPRRLLFTYQARKVGYYRQHAGALDPEAVGMRVERFAAPYPAGTLTALYPSMPVAGWLEQAGELYREGTRLATFTAPSSGTPETTVPLSPPRADSTLPEGPYRVLPHFGSWLERVGLGPLGRIVALAPVDVPTPDAAPDAELVFDPHSPRSTTRDGVLYLLLPRDVPAETVFGVDEEDR